MLLPEFHSFHPVLVKCLQSSARVNSHRLTQHNWYFVLHSEAAVLPAGALSVIWHQWWGGLSLDASHPEVTLSCFYALRSESAEQQRRKRLPLKGERKKRKVDGSAPDWQGEGRLSLIQQKQVTWHAALMDLQYLCQLQIQIFTQKKTNRKNKPKKKNLSNAEGAYYHQPPTGIDIMTDQVSNQPKLALKVLQKGPQCRRCPPCVCLHTEKQR